MGSTRTSLVSLNRKSIADGDTVAAGAAGGGTAGGAGRRGSGVAGYFQGRDTL